MTGYHALFANRLCDIDTAKYLLNEELSGLLTPLIAQRFDIETDQLKLKLTKREACDLEGGALRVALSNVALDGFTGSELWTVEAAQFLSSAGAAVIVYSPRIGRVAKLLSESGIFVTSSVEEVVDFCPSVLHVNHFEAVRPLVDRLVGHARIVNMIHGLLPRPGLPGNENVDRYCSVSIHAKAKVHILTNTPWPDIDILPNSFDERRFTSTGDPARFGRALLYSSRTTPQHREKLRSVLAGYGLELEHLGQGGTPTTEPENLLPQFDVIFAVGRSAIEALASGAHVILWDAGIAGPAVTASNFWQCVTANFALAANVLTWRYIENPDAPQWIGTQLSHGSEDARVATTRLTRNHLNLSRAGLRLLALYQRVLNSEL
ncbi:hypothetical protein LPW26_10245 [Rhodopseudomonas sp. HC1]|uniref:hypothetical protein n=1 Tax=Rhodopseudomonas infernalis TaxID=2897386 RepID=UPI001EE7F05E|nr:hypothetical protein [Rhodopseudomonas infernalis]MCG6205017.1 hypothetical protein [Rhodopseudomonas infernalis]